MNLAGLRNVWQNTPCPICHPAVACLPHWCCWTVLPDGAIQHKMFTKFTACKLQIVYSGTNHKSKNFVIDSLLISPVEW